MLTIKHVDLDAEIEDVQEITRVWYKNSAKSLEIASPSGEVQKWTAPGIYYVMNDSGSTIAKYTIY